MRRSRACQLCGRANVLPLPPIQFAADATPFDPLIHEWRQWETPGLAARKKCRPHDADVGVGVALARRRESPLAQTEIAAGVKIRVRHDNEVRHIRVIKR